MDNQKIDNTADNTHTVNNNWNVKHEKKNTHNGDVVLGSAVNLGNSVNKGKRCFGGPGDCPQLINLREIDLTNLRTTQTISFDEKKYKANVSVTPRLMALLI